MELITYIRKPFTVEAIEITDENMEEVAGLIGEVREKGGEKYIAVNRRIVPNISRAFAGWYLTKLGENYRCYSPIIFTDQFIEHTPGTGYFFDQEDDDLPVLTTEQKDVVQNIFDKGDIRIDAITLTTNEGFPGSSVQLVTND